MYTYLFVIIWICFSHGGTEKRACYFHFESFFSTARFYCKSPTAADIIHSKERLEQKNISGITTIHMEFCNITMLSPETFDFDTFVQIRNISLRSNSISNLPENLFQVSALILLEYLDLDHNELSYLSPKLFAYLPNLYYLDLSFNKFTNFQPGLFSSNPLNYLDLSGNNLELLPDEFLAGNVSLTLTNLHLKRNKFREMPQCVLFLEKLTKIDLSFNHFETLPKYVFHNPVFSNLKSLILSHNNITVLPIEIFHSLYLINLREIDLSYNQIYSVPSGFLKNKALKNLERLFLNNNNIYSFTEDMLPNQLVCFCELDLANNKISSMGDIVLKVLGNMSDCPDKYFRCILNLSNNRLNVQKTNFIQTVVRDPPVSINGRLDVSANNISKFEVISNFSIFQEKLHLTVPLQKQWLFTEGNQIFSVINLVKAALNIDLNNWPITFTSSNVPTFPKLLRLIVLIKAFPYEYDCNCDMLTYLKLQNSVFFKTAVYEYKRYLPLYQPLRG